MPLCDQDGGNSILNRRINSRLLKRVVEADSWVSLCAVVLLLLASNSLRAADISDDEIFPFDIPRQQAVLSLIDFADQAGLTFIVPYETIRDKLANAVHGEYSIEDAAHRLLDGTGLRPLIGRDGALIVRAGDGPVAEEANVATNTRRNTIAGFFAGIFAGGAANDAPARVSRSASAAAMLEEIVVTARRREENHQDLPLSVAAISADMMEAMGIYDIKDISGFVPNVSFRETDGRGTAVLFIRGIGGGSGGGGTRSAGSALYLDGHYIASGARALSTLDMERVEVLRGPQGTLFGKNTNGGAIQYISNKPQQEFDAEIMLRGGDFGQKDFRGMINVPFSNTVSGRFAVGKETYDGHYFNRALYRDYGAWDVQSFSGSLRFTPNDNWMIDLAIRTNSDDSDQTGGQCRVHPSQRAFDGMVAAGFDVSAYQAYDDGVDPWGSFNGVGNLDRIYPGATLDFWDNCALDNQLGEYVTSAGHDGFVDRDIKFYSATAQWDWNSATGSLDNPNVTLTASRMTQSRFSFKDADYTPVRADAFGGALWGAGQTFTSDTLELLFSADVSDRFGFVAGTHWYNNRDQNGGLECLRALKANFELLRNDFTLDANGDPVGGDVSIPCFPSGSTFDRISDNTLGNGSLGLGAKSGFMENESLAIFGQLSFALDDDWTLDVGARHTTEDRTFDFVEHTTVPGTCVTNPIYFLNNPNLPNAPTEANLIAMGLPTSNPGAQGPAEACIPDSVLSFDSVFLGGFTNDLKDTFTASTGLVSLARTLTSGNTLDSGMIYGTISQGFLSGAFNDELNVNFVPELTPLVTIQPEFVTNYEVGFKGTLADGRARLAATLFYMDYTDKQESVDIDNGDGVYGPDTQVSVTTNASTVEIYGIEFELRARLWDGGFLALDIGYLENEYGEFTSFDPDAPGQVVDRTGLTIRDFSPEWTVSTLVEHTFLLGNGASLTPNVSVYWQDDYDFTSGLEGGPPSKCNQEAYALVRARVSFQPSSDAWEASLFGSNVTDERYFSFCAIGRAGVYDYTYGAPDRWGLEFQMNFGG